MFSKPILGKYTIKHLCIIVFDKYTISHVLQIQSTHIWKVHSQSCLSSSYPKSIQSNISLYSYTVSIQSAMSDKLISLLYVKCTINHAFQRQSAMLTKSYHSYMISSQSAMSSKLIHGKYTYNQTFPHNRIR